MYRSFEFRSHHTCQVPSVLHYFILVFKLLALINSCAHVEVRGQVNMGRISFHHGEGESPQMGRFCGTLPGPELVILNLMFSCLPLINNVSIFFTFLTCAKKDNFWIITFRTTGKFCTATFLVKL